MGAEPRPYSPEYGAALFSRCLKIPAKRPSQIETNRFDLKRRSHRAIRSFRSITVLRKRSERRALRRGSPGASLPSFAALRKKVAPAGAKEPSSYPRPRHSGQSSGLLRIRRLSLRFVSLSRRLRRASFFARPKKEAKEMRQREPIPKAVPFGILPHRPGGCGPLEIPRGFTKDERREFGREERIATPAARVRNDEGRGIKTVEYSVYMTATVRSFSVMRRRRLSFRQGS